MLAFLHSDGHWYYRVRPCKRLFNSTTIWEVVNRGDVFAVRMYDGVLTVIPGKSIPKQTERVQLPEKFHSEIPF